MTRRTRRPALATFIALAATLLIAATSVASPFTSAATLRTAPAGVPVLADDIAANGQSVAVGWEEVTSGVPAAYVRSSTDGTTFSSKVRLDPSNPQRNVQLAVCDGWWWAVSQMNLPSDEHDGWSIYLQGRSLDGVHSLEGPVLANALATVYTQTPDIACVGTRRTAVAWLEKDGYASAHAKAEIDPLGSRLPDEANDYAIDLGQARLDGGIAVAGSDSTAFIGWFKGRHFQLRRFSVGGGSTYTVTPHPAVTLFDAQHGHAPVMSADGSTVVLTYTNDEGQWVRISTDGGLGFSAPHRLLEIAPSASAAPYARSVAVRGSRIVIEVTDLYGPSLLSSHELRFASLDLGGSWTRANPADGGERVGALMVIGGATKLAEAWDERNSSATHQWLSFHHEV